MVDFNVSPYYDDYNASKQFYRLLFVPGRAVQARELTQLQTILQNQVGNLTDHIFEDGSQVIPGEIAYDSNYDYVKLQDQYNSVDIDVDNFANTIITGQTSEVKAQVIGIASVLGSDPNTLFIKYIDSGTDGEVGKFSSGEVIETDGGTTYYANVATSSPTGKGSSVTIKEGVYYTKGILAQVNQQTLVLEKYSNTPSYRVGVEVVESFITEGDDTSLLDNAAGSENESAPGAHRYKVSLILAKRAIDSSDDENFIELLRISNGTIQERFDRPRYAYLEDELAKRTFEESGNYTITPYGIDVREHLNDGSNRGVYTVGDGGDAAKIALGMEPGKSYVNGYRIENISTKFIDIDKARETRQQNNSVINAEYGAYIIIENVYSFPNITNFSTIDLHDTAIVTPGTASGSKVGTAKVHGIELHSGTAGSGTEEYKLYIFDVKMNTGKTFTNDVESLYFSDSPAFTADTVLNSNSELVYYNALQNTSLFHLQFSPIKTVRSSDATVDTSYTVRRELTGTADGSGDITFNAGTNEVFSSYTSKDYTATIISGINAGDVIDLDGNVTLGGIPTGKSVTLNLGSNAIDKDVRVVVTLIKQVAGEKSKTLTSGSLSITSPTSTISLEKADIYRITGIYDSGDSGVDATDSDTDIKSRYDLDNGQRDAYYGLGSITLKSGNSAPTGRILIKFEYFTHGSGDYFSADSYDGQIDYADIGTYTTKAGVEYELRDVLDFRPRINDAGTAFTGTGSGRIEMVKPTSTIRADFSYYLNRIDKVYVDEKGNFGVVKGASESDPKIPNDLDNTMSIYNVYVRAYTFGTQDVLCEAIENRRYTMRDIGRIANRVTNLEYYTSLSLLEKETADLKVLDNSGLDRFKNGFIVDNFAGHSIGDVENTDYRCAIDKDEGILRPQFNEENVPLQFNASSSSDYQKTGDLITLPYTEEVFISQEKSSRKENVNPYAIFTFRGSIALNPPNDEWKDTERSPDLNVTLPDNADLLVDLAERTGVTGTQWNSWQDSWVGATRSTRSSSVNREVGNNVNQWGVSWPVRFNTTTTTVSSTTVGQTRSGIQTSVEAQNVTRDLGDRVVNVQIVPFIRAREVEFKATRLKPNTRVYAFFDGIDVNSYIRPPFGNSGDPLVTDSNGAVGGTFDLPNTDTLRFRTGERVFRLTDSSTNRNDNTTEAEVTYQAQGLLETRQNTILSTRVAQVERQQVSDSRTITRTSVARATTNGEWFDPLAQTIMVEEDGGCFITGIDLYFASKSTNIPVTVQMRNVVNGYPGPFIFPFGEKTLNPADVNVSDDGTSTTKFTFDSPVYLQEGVEYCFVVLADTTDYELYVARIGENQIGTENPISQQPYAGVMFKSQNASTWTADQTQDISFRLYKANFDTSKEPIVTLENKEVELQLLGTNPFTTTDTSNEITVFHKNHGMIDGSSVTISGVANGTYNNIPHTELNAKHTVSNVEHNKYTITVSTNANATGEVGGSVVYAEKNIPFDSLYPIIQQTVLPNTGLAWAVKTTSAQSIHGSQTPWLKDTYYQLIEANATSRFLSPRTIASATNETDELSGEKSFEMQAVMASSNSNVSPVIDTARMSLIAIHNIINNPDNGNVADFVAETDPQNTSSVAKYITKRITLSDPAIALKVLIGASKPENATIELYYKTLTIDESTTFKDKDWTEIQPEETIISSARPDVFREYSLLADNIEQFTAFQVKIVMKSTSSAEVPKIRDFRAIALGT